MALVMGPLKTWGRRAVADFRANSPVVLIVVLLGSSSTAIWYFYLRGLEGHNESVVATWWTVGLAFVFVESFVVSLHFRSESGSFSLLEIPLVFGLLFLAPSTLWLIMPLGAGIGLLVIRRQPLIKLAFNIANLSLHAAIAAAVFSLVLGEYGSLGKFGWLALLLATSVSSLVEVLCINLVIAITERDLRTKAAFNMLIFGWVVAAANTAQALIAALVVREEPWGILLLGGSTFVLFAAYRAYVSERDHRERIEFLYDSTRSLRQSSETDAAVSVLLGEATSMFRAASAELILFPAPETEDQPRWFRHHDDETVSVTGDRQLRLLAELIASESAEPVLVTFADAPSAIASFMNEQGLSDAMVGALRSDQRTVGLIVVGDRLGNVTAFNSEDLRLFSNLVDQAAVALENDQLEQTLGQLRELEAQLSFQARFDGLTGLANRIRFDDELVKQVSKGTETTHVLYVDLDDFKLVNDSFSHAAGDELLIDVARRLEDIIRSTDVAARLGGDEFALLLRGDIDASAVAHRVIGSLGAPYMVGVDEIRIGSSVGIALAKPTDTASALLHRADLAMYAAKEQGKGSVVWYSEDINSLHKRQQELQTSLRRAIDECEFEVLYQPIVNLEHGSIVGAEALVRWRNNGVLVEPGVFIGEAERSGLIISIDREVRKQVASQVQALTEAAPSSFFASVNLSARHLQQPNFVEDFIDDIRAAGADPTSFVLEVTESAFAGDLTKASQKLAQIRAFGTRIALDDFGTGYSSLSYLRDLPIDFLKIAQPFISDLTGVKDTSFVEAIMAIGHSLSLTVIAEGIEEEAQLTILNSLSCEYGQGFLFARPMDFASLTDRLANAHIQPARH